MRLILDSPAAGPWNMAVDELLLESVADGGDAALRLYQWSEPTMSLGYFQRLTDRARHPASRECAIVRRHSGGGAIVHDREVTYSIALPLSDRWSANAEALYLQIHHVLIDALSPWTDQLSLSDSSDNGEFLCFQRRAVGDVLLGPHKVIGSAQRRRRGGLLQHGSILLSQSPSAPELPGIEQLVENVIPWNDLIVSVGSHIGASFGWQFTERLLTVDEKRRVSQLIDEKWGSAAWLTRR